MQQTVLSQHEVLFIDCSVLCRKRLCHVRWMPGYHEGYWVALPLVRNCWALYSGLRESRQGFLLCRSNIIAPMSTVGSSQVISSLFFYVLFWGNWHSNTAVESDRTDTYKSTRAGEKRKSPSWSSHGQERFQNVPHFLLVARSAMSKYYSILVLSPKHPFVLPSGLRTVSSSPWWHKPRLSSF